VSETRERFFVSDLHIGGDEQLKFLDFEEEFVEFLKSLEEREIISRIRKAAPRELSVLQRLVSRKPGRDALEDIPQRTVVG
jgi:HEPN domain-containing protein